MRTTRSSSTLARSTRSTCGCCGRSATTERGRVRRARISTTPRAPGISTGSAASGCTTSAATIPRVRAALVEALELDTPGKLALGVNPLAGLLAEALLERAPSGLGRVLFTSSGTEAVEAAIKIGRAATGRTRVALRRTRLPRPDARCAVGLRRRRILRPLRSRSCRASRGSPGTTSTRSSESCAPATWRCSSSSRSSATASSSPRPATWRAPRRSAARTARSSASTRYRPGSAARAASSRSSTGVSSRTSSPWRSRCQAATSPSARRCSGPRCSMPCSTRWSTR